MKKFIVALLIVTLCVAMVCPALAAESFTPSVTYKPAPELTGPVEENGMRVGNLMVDGEIIGGLYLKDGRLYVICEAAHPEGVAEDHECLIVTPYAEVPSEHQIPDEDKTLIYWVYEQILALGMKFFETCEGLNEHIASVLGEGKTVQDLVVKDLFEVTVLCDELEEWLEPEGTTICLDFDLNLAPGTFVEVVAYKGGEWRRIEAVEVLDNGHVVCNTFENFCPIAILVSNEQLAETGAVEAVNTGDNSNMGLWMAVAGVSLAALLVCFIGLRKTKKA